MPCSAWTNKLITAKDHASVQINIGHLNEDGVYTNQFTTFALAGKVRAQVRPGKGLGSVWGARWRGHCGSGTQSSLQHTLQAAGDSRRQQEIPHPRGQAMGLLWGQAGDSSLLPSSSRSSNAVYPGDRLVGGRQDVQ